MLTLCSSVTNPSSFSPYYPKSQTIPCKYRCLSDEVSANPLPAQNKKKITERAFNSYTVLPINRTLNSILSQFLTCLCHMPAQIPSVCKLCYLFASASAKLRKIFH